MAEYSKGDGDDKQLDPESDEAILQRINEYFDYDTLNWQPIRDEADIDVRYASNDTWSADDKTRARVGRC
jgi:hypothetical protein